MLRTRQEAPAFRRGFLRFAHSFLVSLLASFVALSHFAALSHMAFVAHASCAEHGELVHAPSGAAALAPNIDTKSPDEVAAGHDSIASDEHDHCAAGWARSGDMRAMRPASCVFLPEEAALIASPQALLPPRVRESFPAPIDILLLSPKSSPPL
jgi:hypothetical protein